MVFENEAITFEQMPQLILTLTKEVHDLKEMIKQLINQKQSEEITVSWMSREELKEYLPDHPSVSTIHRLTSEGQIPFHKIGRKLCFLRSEIDKWILEKSKKSKSEISVEAQAYCINKNRSKLAPWRATTYS